MQERPAPRQLEEKTEAPQPTSSPSIKSDGKPDGWDIVAKDPATLARLARAAQGERMQ